MSKAKTPSIFATLQKTAEHASTANSELVRQLPVDSLEDNPLNAFSMAEDEAFRSTLASVEEDGFLDDLVVTPCGEGRWRVVSGHRRLVMARRLGKATVPCKVRTYGSRLEELRALMGANLHRRVVSPFDMARQLKVLRQTLEEAGALPAGVKEQAERLAEETHLSRATVERYLDLWNLSDTLTAWAEGGDMALTDAYELARKKNVCLQPLVEDYVARADEGDKADFPALVHRAIQWAKTGLGDKPSRAQPRQTSPLRAVDTLDRSLRRGGEKLRGLAVTEDTDRAELSRKLDLCLTHLEELKAQVEAQKQALDRGEPSP